MCDSPLDDVDRGILHLLQEDARYTITDIANEVGVSGNTVRNRIERLTDRGVIKGYAVDINYKEAGLDLHFAFTCTASITEREELAKRALDVPGVVKVRGLMTGRENIHIEGVGTDAEDITRIAMKLDSLGLDVVSEGLVRNDYSKPFAEFHPTENATEE